MYDWQINITLRFSLWISSLFLFFGEAERLSEYGVTIVISKCFGVISWLYLPGKVLSIMPCCNVITGSQTALACVQQGFPHSFSLLPPAGSEKETGEASPCRNIHEHAKAWITLKSCYSLHSLVCVCQCVEHPSICSKYHPNASSLICMMRETTLCAFAFIPYLVCRCTLGFGMLSVLSLMFWWCFAAESWGDSSLPCSVSGVASYEWDSELNGRQKGSTVSP